MNEKCASVRRCVGSVIWSGKHHLTLFRSCSLFVGTYELRRELKRHLDNRADFRAALPGFLVCTASLKSQASFSANVVSLHSFLSHRTFSRCDSYIFLSFMIHRWWRKQVSFCSAAAVPNIFFDLKWFRNSFQHSCASRIGSAACVCFAMPSVPLRERWHLVSSSRKHAKKNQNE